MRRLLLLASVALLVCGCGSSGLAARIAALKEFTAEDARTALAIATKGGDKPAMQCFPFIVAKLESLKAIEPAVDPSPDTFPGLLEQFATLRVAIHGSSMGEDFLADLDLNCAALRTSVEIDVAKGALLGASVAGSGGGTAPKAAAKVIPILLRLLRR